MPSAAKRIRLSDDSGSTWSTLPGNTGELRNEGGEIVDTVFGQSFASALTGLIGWSITSNALYKGFAGYVATLKQSGTSTAMTGESATLVSGKTYQIDDATKQIFDRNTTVVVNDGGSPVAAANIESLDYLFGRVTFAASYTPSGAITFDGAYLPTSAVGKGNSFTLTQTMEGVDNTDFETAQGNGGYRTFQDGLKQVSLELGGIYQASNGFLAQLTGRNEVVIEINPDGNGASVCRGFFRLTSQAQQGNVGELEEESITFQLSVPDDDLLEAPFSWNHSGSSTINNAIKIALDSWESATAIDVQYLPDGTTGVEGGCWVTEISLSGGLEVMNEFSVNLQGTGATSTV